MFMILGAMAFAVLACSIVSNDPEGEERLSFTKSFDDLARFDSVHIILRDTSGKTIDVLYRGTVDTVREIEDRPAPHWDGKGIAVVSFIGFQGGVVVYQVDRKFNGTNDQILDTNRVILPGTELSAKDLELTLTEGDSVALPRIEVTPAELTDKTFSYVSSAPQIVKVTPNALIALQRGSAKLTATLKSNPAKSLILNVTILPNPLIPDSIFLAPDTLRLAAEGALGSLTVKASPSSADPVVTWISRDVSTAQVLDGMVQGLKPGRTVILGTSKRKPSVADSAVVIVSGPLAVTLVAFRLDTLELFVGGAAESLMVDVLPAPANPRTELIALDPALVLVQGGRVQGKVAGKTKVVARSLANPAVTDTLQVTVLPTQHIDDLQVLPDSLRLFMGGPSGMVTAKVSPASMSQSVLWRIANPALASIDASGKVTAKLPGATWAVALSRADSSKKDSALMLLKRDMPQVSVGRDTVVPLGSVLTFRPKISQEYGSIIVYRWDLDGDGVSDGTSDSIKTMTVTYAEAKEVTASFYVKDTEGNDTTVFRKIKIVSGPAVQILEPADSTYTRLFSINVRWTVNNKEQDSLKSQTLALGKNTLTRSAKDEGGNVYSASVTVIVDTTPPNRPLVHGPSFSGSRTPSWTWASGGGGGSGNYRYWLDVDDSSKGKLTTDTAFTSGTDLTEGTHTLFVAERDKAGNWSAAGRWSIKVDLTLPGAPLVSVTPALSPTNVRRPVWNWSTGGNGGSGAYQYKLDNSSLTSGATSTSGTSFTPTTNLSHGSHTLYVQEKDSSGNWSESGFATILIDTIAPGTPTLSVSPTSPTNDAQPTWTWSSGGGGKGIYRWKVGDTVWTSGASQGTETSFKPGAGLPEGTRTLFVEEQDSAGNWSGAGSKAIVIDVTKPGAPIVSSLEIRTLILKPTWTWTSVGSGGGGYRYRLDNPDLTSGSDTTSRTAYTPGNNLDEGGHVLYVQEKDIAGNWSNSGSFSVKIHGQTGYAVGGHYLLRTTNGGANWLQLSTGPDISMNSVFFSTPDQGIVVGAGGRIARTSNKGVTWSSVSSGLDSIVNLNSVHFTNSNVGFAGGSPGRMIRSTDGGQSWAIKESGIDMEILSVHLTNDQSGYAVGAGGDAGFSIFQTKNGGETWTQPKPTVSGGFRGAVWFTSTTTGYVVSEYGLTLKTSDAGSKWDTLDTGLGEFSAQLISVHFPSPDTGYICGGNGLLLRTINAGKNWKTLTTNSTETFNSIFFTNGRIGIAVGESGTIFRTIDAGDNWINVAPPAISGSPLKAVFFP